MKKKKSQLKKGITTVLAASMLLTGCTGNQPVSTDSRATQENEEGKQTEAGTQKTEQTASESAANTQTGNDELVQRLQQKYAGASAGEYDGNVIRVKRDEPVTLELAYNPNESDEKLSDSFVIYQDAELQYPVEAGDMEYDAVSKTLTIAPPFYGIAEMDSNEMELGYLSGNYLKEDEGHAWGTLPQYYLASNVDTATGKHLDKPVITVIKIDAEIAQAPQLVFDQTDDGYARFSWKEVPGAYGYLLFTVNKDQEGFWEDTRVFADVKGLEWTSEDDEEYNSSNEEGEVLSLNGRFAQYYSSEDSESWKQDNDNFLSEFDTGEAYDKYYGEYFGIVAYNGEGCSPVGNFLSAKDLAHMLPNKEAYYSNEDSFYNFEGTLGLPAVMNVTMCDGTTAQKILDYDFDAVRKDEDNNCFYISARAGQTPFTTEILADTIDWEHLDTDLSEVRERQEKLKNKGGSVKPDVTIDGDGGQDKSPSDNADTDESEAKQEQSESQTENAKSDKVDIDESEREQEQSESQTENAKSDNAELENGQPQEDIAVTANSALSEYIALHMLQTRETIDLSAFPEAADPDRVVDALFEAEYQNPLILGIQGAGYDEEGRMLYIEYDFDRNTTAKKQEAVQEKVDEIVSSIISDGMSDLEKETAINEYLCENASYDNAALDNAEQNSFLYVDENFYDSFTAYGILMDGVGVCAGYSAAFKLLADAAGVESIVVTGYLNGSLPHAWNKVRIDGEWYIVDSTNNDNDLIQNALFNLSDTAAYGTLVEDDRFAMDQNLSDYVSGDDGLEYYHTTGRYFERDEIADRLAEVISADGSAVLRTDYDMGDEEFGEIAQQTADKAQKNVIGFYWMGVIHLES